MRLSLRWLATRRKANEIIGWYEQERNANNVAMAGRALDAARALADAVQDLGTDATGFFTPSHLTEVDVEKLHRAVDLARAFEEASR